MSNCRVHTWGCQCTIDERHRLAARVKELEEQLHRSATVCPKDGCMLWLDHKEPHATAEQVSAALAVRVPDATD